MFVTEAKALCGSLPTRESPATMASDFVDYPLIMSVDSPSTPLHQAVKTLKEGSDGLFYASTLSGE